MKLIIILAVAVFSTSSLAADQIIPSVQSAETCVLQLNNGSFGKVRSIRGECSDSQLDLQSFQLKIDKKSMAVIIQAMENQGLSLTGIANFSNYINILTFKRK